nr:hypothetical protein [Comamonas serinivorans]
MPLGTPPEVQASLRDAVAQVFKSPSARERFAAQQIQLPQAAGQFAGRVAQEQQRWARLLAPQSAQR